MKILKEQQIRQDELPITFITSFVSRGWEEVGMLKEQIKALKTEFKNVDKIEEILQGLIDAYLINIGQLELFLQENDYVEVPEVEETETEESEESEEEVEAGKDSHLHIEVHKVSTNDKEPKLPTPTVNDTMDITVSPYFYLND